MPLVYPPKTLMTPGSLAPRRAASSLIRCTSTWRRRAWRRFLASSLVLDLVAIGLWPLAAATSCITAAIQFGMRSASLVMVSLTGRGAARPRLVK